MDIATKQELVDYVNSKDVPQETKDGFARMSESEASRLLARIRTSEQVDALLGAQF